MYDFECTQCGHVFEDIIPSTAEPPACPECSSATIRLMSPVHGRVKTKSKKAEYYTSKTVQDRLAAELHARADDAHLHRGAMRSAGRSAPTCRTSRPSSERDSSGPSR